MGKTTRKERWMRIGLILMVSFIVMPYASVDEVSLIITLPATITATLAIIFILFFFVNQHFEIIIIAGFIIEKICQFLFTYHEFTSYDSDVYHEHRAWCKQNSYGFWFSFSCHYYFLSKKDAAMFKLVWG